MEDETTNIDVTDQADNCELPTGFFGRLKYKLKNGNFTCPFCREEYKGISELGAHLKDHCT